MKAYILFLELAAAGVLFLVLRWGWHKLRERKERAAQDVRKQGSAASRAERDRADCKALEAKLGDGASSTDPDRPSLGALREARRGSTRNESSFDPDLPPRIRNPATGA